MVKRRALILTWSGFQDQEVIYPYYRIQEEGFDVDILADDKDKNGTVSGIFGISFPVNIDVSKLDLPAMYSNMLNNYDLLVIPGGVKALEKLRQQKTVLEFIKDWNKKSKIITSTCHGAQMLISAKIVSSKKISGYYSIKDDIENAHATYVDAPAVVDGNIITSPHYKHMGAWMKTTFDVYYEKYRV